MLSTSLWVALGATNRSATHRRPFLNHGGPSWNHWVSAEYELVRPSIGVANRRAQPMNDPTKRISVAWWLTIDALMIVVSLTIIFSVIWLAR